MKKILKKSIPPFILNIYYYLVALVGAIINNFPSRKMVVIGVTGTKGKTSAINYIWACLSAGGIKTGLISTANIKIDKEEVLNKYHMTMPGRFVIQGLMAKMVKAGCQYCLVEVTSEGIKQKRNTGIIFDTAIFTNLTPEHLPSHGGSFEKYKETKGKLFANLTKKYKKINGEKINKTIIVNSDSEHASYFGQHKADRKVSFGIKNEADFKALNPQETSDGVVFSLDGKVYKLGILGVFNVYNALPAIIVAKLAGVSDTDISTGLANLHLIPGRMEKINEGQKFLVLVDYAHEKESITNVLNTANHLKKPGSKTIILLGAEGGGRDKAKRALMGELAGRLADYVFVTNVDPYEDDPKGIIEDIAVVAEKAGKIRGQNLFTIEDRRESINKALIMAKENDVVLITGKGAEQSMVIDGKSIPWDDRTVVREELRKIKTNII
jgi:UDP-N-acetylmuramoyl-L-alanyl-D-glutamate--2,6-diaminopimelate ligase